MPPHFLHEWRGGEGQVIHHKFVVCDFNGPNPVVFCGSSNLAKGGEKDNGDNLLAIYDPDIATYYAVEAIRLFDHYHFRSMEENAPSDTPLTLDKTADWVAAYFDPNHFKCRERRNPCGKANGNYTRKCAQINQSPDLALGVNAAPPLSRTRK